MHAVTLKGPYNAQNVHMTDINPGQVSTSALDKMAADIERQITKRAKYSRRRTHVDDADISYINERNKKFNEKCERFYGKYTEEIRGNLERGTAL